MKIMSVVGARPNFMKVAPIIKALRDYRKPEIEVGSRANTAESIHHVLVHTGQHYDPLMSGSFFTDLNLPSPDVDLSVGSGSHAVQTANVMRTFEEVLLREKPDIVVVVGDVNSTLACALVAAKISFDTHGSRPLIAHVEAGLRSFDRTMPEEINRIITDQLSDLLFVTEESGLRNLTSEGVPAPKIHFVGNTMIDSLLGCNEKSETSTVLDLLGLRRKDNNGCVCSASPYALLTLHRPANVDTCEALLNILGGLAGLVQQCPVIFPVHPRTRSRIREFGLERCFEWNNSHNRPAESQPNAVRIIEPLGYLDFLCLMKNSKLVITDSGGIQEETTCLGIPCVTVRNNTERPVTIESGSNIVAGTTKENIASAIRQQWKRKQGNTMPEKWDGKAATRIVDILVRVHRQRTWSPGPPTQPSHIQPTAFETQSL